MFRFVTPLISGALVAAALVATPALAADRAHSPQQISDALKAGCTVQTIHSPSGKAGHQDALVHCKKARTLETASRDTPREQRKSGVD